VRNWHHIVNPAVDYVLSTRAIVQVGPAPHDEREKKNYVTYGVRKMAFASLRVIVLSTPPCDQVPLCGCEKSAMLEPFFPIAISILSRAYCQNVRHLFQRVIRHEIPPRFADIVLDSTLVGGCM